MKWVKDRTGRFAERPHYLPEEMDAQCEKIVSEFLAGLHGKIAYPVTTDDLTILIESLTQDLDLYADLAGEGFDVEGVTDFFRGARPKVRIEKRLTDDDRMANRLRTTLTHELGHVVFHDFMFQGTDQPKSLFNDPVRSVSNKCKRDTIVGAPQADWMEWQAGFACGAFLMPWTAVRTALQTYTKRWGLAAAKFGVSSAEGQGLISAVAELFEVSRDAARVRLQQRDILIEGRTGGVLF